MRVRVRLPVVELAVLAAVTAAGLVLSTRESRAQDPDHPIARLVTPTRAAPPTPGMPSVKPSRQDPR